MGSSRLRRAGVNAVTGQRHQVTTKATQGDSACLHPKKGSQPRRAFNILSQPILNDPSGKEAEKVLACVEHRPTSEILRVRPRPPKRSEHRNQVSGGISAGGKGSLTSSFKKRNTCEAQEHEARPCLPGDERGQLQGCASCRDTGPCTQKDPCWD